MMKNLIDKINSRDFWSQLLFPFIGMASLIWFLIRVIPKPTRAGYPCIRVAAPLASSFVMYVLGIMGSIAAFKYAKFKFRNAQYVSGIIAFISFLIFSSWYIFDSAEPAKAIMLEQLPANVAIGEARGIFPGRVVWSWNPEATNENCDGSFNGDGVITNLDNIYYVPSNNNESVIKEMLSVTILTLTGTSDEATAWDSVFTYFNRTVRGETHGYQSGEKIFIKTNNQGIGLTFNMNADLTQREGPVWGSYPPDMAATSPYIILATIDQLVNKAGIPEDVIFVGDPHLNINRVYYEILSADFPDVHYMGVNGNPWEQMKDCEAYGRTLSIPTDEEVIFYSDRGEFVQDSTDKIFQQMFDADYMINIAALKSHIRAGITLFGKTHFGSHTEDDAFHLHPGLVSPGDQGEGENQGYGKYRVLVDLLGHEHLGGKTILNILDGLWGGDHHELYRPRKWNMAPFNGDYTSSIFASIDPIAAASVAHDFLRTEYNIDDWGEEAYPNFLGTDDHLQQAADSTKWPEGFAYDPEKDGTPLQSLGTHEHWNNADDMQYTRNLGTGNGIELVKMFTRVILNNPIADLDIEMNAADTTVDLSGVFFAPLNDQIELSVIHQTNPALVTASIEDSSLVLSFTTDMIGTDTLTVQASVPGDSLTDEFVVTVTQATAISMSEDLLPLEYKLSQNYPNPFNPETTIPFALPENSEVIIAVYDINGRHITDIFNGYKSPGYHTVTWNASNLASGSYFYQIRTEKFTQVKKCTMVK